MAVGGLQAANGVAKLAGGGYAKIYQDTAELYNRMSKGTGKKFGSRGYELPTEVAGVYTHGFPSDGGALPVGESVQTIKPLVFPKRYMHAIQLTGASMEELSKYRKDISYVESWTQLNIDGAVDAAHKMLSIYGWGTSNGRLATISTGAGSTTQTVSNNDNTRYLRYGMRISIVDPVTYVPRGSSYITSDPAPADTTFTINSTITSVTGDYVIIQGGANAVQEGLSHIIDDGTLGSVYFQNVNRTTTPKYKAELLNGNSLSLSLTTMRKMLGAKIFPAMGTLKRGDYEIWSYESQWSAMAALGWTLKRYDGKSKSLDLGFTTMEWEGIPWVTDVDCPKDRVYFINWKTIQKFTTKDWGWDETTGSIFNRIPSATSGHNFDDSFEAYYDIISNFGCPDPRQNGLIYALAVPSGY